MSPLGVLLVFLAPLPLVLLWRIWTALSEVKNSDNTRREVDLFFGGSGADRDRCVRVVRRCPALAVSRSDPVSSSSPAASSSAPYSPSLVARTMGGTLHSIAGTLRPQPFGGGRCGGVHSTRESSPNGTDKSSPRTASETHQIPSETVGLERAAGEFSYARELLETDDGGQLALDWVVTSAATAGARDVAVVLLIPGFEGGSER
jgi:hypothetical protein